MTEHETSIEEARLGLNNFGARAKCSCGWVGDWFESLWNIHRPLRQARTHRRRAERNKS